MQARVTIGMTLDRWVRNHFAEGQLTRADWIDNKPRYMDRRPNLPNETAEQVAERNLGTFGGWMTGGDWASRMGVMHCCTGNATRTLYYLWEHVATQEGNTLRVNLLLNHASAWADVYSYNPNEGRVDVAVKTECGKVLVRLPEWVKRGSEAVACRVNEQARAVVWEGRYVNAGSAKPGDTIVVTYPIGEYVTKELLIDALYTLVVRGNTVVAIDPAGRHCPLYQRAQYREGAVRWRTVTRFVPDQFPWWQETNCSAESTEISKWSVRQVLRRSVRLEQHEICRVNHLVKGEDAPLSPLAKGTEGGYPSRLKIMTSAFLVLSRLHTKPCSMSWAPV